MGKKQCHEENQSCASTLERKTQILLQVQKLYDALAEQTDAEEKETTLECIKNLLSHAKMLEIGVGSRSSSASETPAKDRIGTNNADQDQEHTEAQAMPSVSKNDDLCTWNHPLAYDPVANFMKGLFATGWSGTKAVENTFRILRRTQEQKSGPQMQRFRALTQAVRVMDPLHRKPLKQAAAKQQKLEAAKYKDRMQKRLAKIGVGFGTWSTASAERIIEEKELDADVVERMAEEPVEIREDLKTEQRNPVTVQLSDWEVQDAEFRKQMQKLGGEAFGQKYFEYQHELPLGHALMTRLTYCNCNVGRSSGRKSCPRDTYVGADSYGQTVSRRDGRSSRR